ncbi:hypothetical protein [Streptomyces microflavus]|uniref:hypothetical protein n=1 Tax=Streptomyces microflavus TaxID=1919 RepID=UPI003819E061
MNSYTPPCPPVDRLESEGPKFVARRNSRLADTGSSLSASRFTAQRARAAGSCLDESAV